MPVAGMLTPYTEQPISNPQPSDTGYFHTDAELSMPQADLHHLMNPSGLNLPQGQIYNNPDQSMNMASMYQQPSLSAAKPAKESPKVNKRQLRASNSRSRQPVPQPQDTHTMDPRASSTTWMTTGASTPSIIARDNTASPVHPQPNSLHQQRSRPSVDRVQTNSPHLQNSTAQAQRVPSPQQPAQLLAAMQTQNRKSPFPSHQRAASRQGRSSQSRTPNAEQSMNSGYRLPQAQNQPPDDLNAPTNYANNAHGNLSGNAPNNLSSRGGYEALSHSHAAPTASASHTSYDYGRNAQAENSSLNPAATSTADQWQSTSQNRQTRSYDRPGVPYDNNTYNAQPHNLAQPSLSLQNFDMRGAAQRKPAGSKGTKQPQTYSQYQPQPQPQPQAQAQAQTHAQPQPHHQQPQQGGNQHLNQNQEWYGFNNGTSNSFSAANHGWL